MPLVDVATCTRPNYGHYPPPYDPVYLGKLALQHAIDYLVLRGISLDDLQDDDAVRTKVLDSLARNDGVFFFGCGHGDENTFGGQRNEPIFWTCDCRELSGRVVYLLSCITGARLGPDMVNNKGAWCYMGYSETFGWIQESVQDPLADKYGRAFFEPLLELIYHLADGGTTGEAFRISIDKWNYWIDYWSKSTDPLAPSVLMLLLHDRDCQKLFGDEAARVASAIPDYWWLLMGLGFAPVGAVLSVVGSEELTKAGVVAV